jgi:tetratricopeptide (TPR) repeat protein
MTVRLSLIIAILLVAAGFALWVTLPPPRPSPFEGAWRSFVAHQYLQRAMAAVDEFPHNRREARACMERALTLAPNEPAIRAAAPSIFVAAGAYDLALNAMAAQAQPDPLLLGQCLLKTGHIHQGQELLLRAGQALTGPSGDRPQAAYQQALALNNIGYILADAGVALPEARAMLERATNELPLEPNCLDSLGWLYYRMGDTHTALFYLERAVRLLPRPGEPEILYHLAVVYNRVGRFQRARRLIERALALDPQHEEARRELENARWLLPKPTVVNAPRPAFRG